MQELEQEKEEIEAMVYVLVIKFISKSDIDNVHRRVRRSV